MAETAVDFLLQSLNHLRKGSIDCPFSVVEINQMGSLYEEVEYLRTCLKDLEKNRTEHQEIEDLLTQIRDVAYEAADIIDLSLANHISKNKRSWADEFVHLDVLYSLRKLRDDLKEIKSTEKEVMEISEKKLCAIGDPQEGTSSGANASDHAAERRMKEMRRIQEREREREREMAETAVDSLLKKLNKLIKGEIDCPFSVTEMNQIAFLYEELQSLRTTCLKDSEHNKKVTSLVTESRYMAYDVADIIDVSIVNNINSQKKRSLAEKIGHVLLYHRHQKLRYVMKEIKSIKKRVMEIYKKKLYGIGDQEVGPSFRGSSSRVSVPNVDEEIVVGFDHQLEMLKERLTGTQKQLKVISIVGMAGLGKTTLARKLYNDPFILYHFYIRGWTYVSQVYCKRDLLLRILSSVFEHEDEISTGSDEKLGEALYKSLKGKRYLVVMDDMWHIGAWNNLKRYFPNDNNGSRILFTSRHTDVALHAKCDGPPHHLPFLNKDESWDLLQKKIFGKESCPPELTDIGNQIARKCQGLPLAIVVVAGLLAKTNKNQDSWKQVVESLRSYIVSDTEQILALSYNSLPHYLRLCFLYFGAFPEDYEISVRKLIWLWIAEGFIHRIGDRSLEDVAEDYLMDLIDRNLVLVAKRRSSGGIKACSVHDLLHDLCLRKVVEENFLQQIYKDEIRACPWYDQRPFSSYLVPTRKKHRRLCVNSHIINYIPSKPFAPHIRSILYFVSERSSLPPKRKPFNYLAFKLLRVLDLSTISILYFPSEIVQLFLLRYLALHGRHLRIPTTIGNLRNLEFLIISPINGFIPNELWNIVMLRHLIIRGENYIQAAPIEYGFPFVLYNLQTISHIFPTWPCQDFLARTPNLRKLGFRGNFYSNGYGNYWFPDLDFLNYLETLKLSNTSLSDHRTLNLQGVKFPPNLKRLTLSRTRLEWKEMSVIEMFPNLEVLKLEFCACIGSRWETSAGGFCRLKYLKLYYMDVEQWNTSSSHFPSLQHLVLHYCHKLKEIPSELGDICTLQTIEVNRCSDSAVNSTRKIQKEQEGIGNDSLKIIITNPPI